MKAVRLVVVIALLACMGIDAHNSKLKLITVLYNERHPERRNEYIECMERNLAHKSIDAIHVLYDTISDDQHDDSKNVLLNYLKSQPITISYIQGRPSFNYCFRVANQLFAGYTVILSNADIYFNETLTVLERYDLINKFLAITRRNVQADGSLAHFPFARLGKPEPSQDVWVFNTPMPEIGNHELRLGEVHCEGPLAYQVAQTGLEVLNPYFSIECCHKHLSRIRHWTDRPYPEGGHIVLPLIYLPDQEAK